MDMDLDGMNRKTRLEKEVRLNNINQTLENNKLLIKHLRFNMTW